MINKEYIVEQLEKLLKYSDNLFLAQAEKEEILKDIFISVHNYHYQNCIEYKNISKNFFEVKTLKNLEKLDNLPFIHAALFKDLNIKSIKDTEILKIMNSSGTTSQPSKIFLDKETSVLQIKFLGKIISYLLKTNHRIPIIFLDYEGMELKNTARSAGIRGMRFFAKDFIFALNKEGKLNKGKILSFLEKHKKENICFYGFTYFIWEILNLMEKENFYIKANNGILLHGGGWKKLESLSISEKVFKEKVKKLLGIKKDNIFEYYGMIEQTGIIHIKCKYGHFHTPYFGDVIIRDIKTLQPIKNKEGYIQVLAPFEISYPGHSVLTEDVGVLLGIDDCPCGWKGKYFKFLRRIKKSDLRGCSNVI